MCLILTFRLLLYQKIGFQGSFSGTEAALTVFAPTNEAFDAAVELLGLRIQPDLKRYERMDGERVSKKSEGYL